MFPMKTWSLSAVASGALPSVPMPNSLVRMSSGALPDTSTASSAGNREKPKSGSASAGESALPDPTKTADQTSKADGWTQP